MVLGRKLIIAAIPQSIFIFASKGTQNIGKNGIFLSYTSMSCDGLSYQFRGDFYRHFPGKTDA